MTFTLHRQYAEEKESGIPFTHRGNGCHDVIRRIGGRPLAIVGEKLNAITFALMGGMSKAAVCRNFGVRRTTLIETLARIGWLDSIHAKDASSLAD